jgi:hypothetical protein
MTNVATTCSINKKPAFTHVQQKPINNYRTVYGFRCYEPVTGKRAKILVFANGRLSSSMINLKPAEYAAYCMACDLVELAASAEIFTFIAQLFLVLGEFEVWLLDPEGVWRVVYYPEKHQREPSPYKRAATLA